MVSMGLQMGLEAGQYCKRTHHWMFIVNNMIGDITTARALPPEKTMRPSISFKESSVHHLIEDVYLPAKPDWKPITVTVFDLKKKENALFAWLTEIYDPQNGLFFEPNVFKNGNQNGPSTGFIREAYLEMYDSCGKIIERWIYEDAWPQSINFLGLDMNQTGIVMAEVTLRYARAYLDTTVG